MVRTDGTDPVALLDAQSAARVPELVPVRYGRMLVSPFTFYRGAAAVMAHDLGSAPHSGLTTQLCGDAHLSNFGLFASPERRLVFDLNDFDETHPGPFEWDIKRLAASLEVAGLNNGFTKKQRRAVVLTGVESYRTTMREFAAMTNMAVWYAHQAVQPGMPGLAAIQSKTARREVQKTVEKAYSRDSLGALKNLTETMAGGLRFVHQPPLVVPARELDLPTFEIDDLQAFLTRVLAEYRQTLPLDRQHLISQYTFVDLARKVVGVGSVGTRAWILLMRGVDDGDPLILQAKEATASVLEAHTAPSVFASHGERVVQGQRLMQAHGDLLLGWHHAPPRPHYYVRQLRDWKGSLVVDALDPQSLGLYAERCAWTLARAHARSGDRLMIAAYLGSKSGFAEAIADFSASYAELNQADYVLLQSAADEGRIPVLRGV